MPNLIVVYKLPKKEIIAERVSVPKRDTYLSEEYWRHIRNIANHLAIKHQNETDREILIYYTTTHNVGNV